MLDKFYCLYLSSSFQCVFLGLEYFLYLIYGMKVFYEQSMTIFSILDSVILF